MGILIPEISILEKIIRPALVYLFLLIAFRVAGKRELGQMTPFDLIVLLTISNVLQNAMIGPDNSLGGGIIGAVTMLGLNGILARLEIASPRLERWLNGAPTPLIENGKIIAANLKKELMTIEELRRSLRKHDLDGEDVAEVQRAWLELDGTVTIQLKKK